MRRLALAIALACVLSGTVRAGEIHSTGAVATPTPRPNPHTAAAAAAGDSYYRLSRGRFLHLGHHTVLTIILTLISIVP